MFDGFETMKYISEFGYLINPSRDVQYIAVIEHCTTVNKMSFTLIYCFN